VTVIKKVGLAPVQRQGMEYEFDVVADMDNDHTLVISKSRCDVISDAVVKKPGAEFWEKLANWLSSGTSPDQQKALSDKLEETLSLVAKKEERIKQFTIDSAVREAYVGLDYEPAALDDVIRNARSVFIMDELGKAVPRDSEGNIIYAKDAKTPIGAKEWLEGLAEKKPYLRRASSGGGNKGNKGSTDNFDRSKATGAQLIAEGLKKGNLNK